MNWCNFRISVLQYFDNVKLMFVLPPTPFGWNGWNTDTDDMAQNTKPINQTNSLFPNPQEKKHSLYNLYF